MRATLHLRHHGIPSTLATDLVTHLPSVPYCERLSAIPHIVLRALPIDLAFGDSPLAHPPIH